MKHSVKKIFNAITLSLMTVISSQVLALDTHAPEQKPITTHPVILFIWDGLRPDSINEKDTPTLYKLKQKGSWFSDNHASYPSFTMMNAASFATGNLAGKTGFFGNILWDPAAHGKDAEGKPQNFNAPVFTEDYKILQDMDQPQKDDPVFFTPTLFANAHQLGIKTASVGKSGPAFIQNYHQEAGEHGIVLDEKHVYPFALANSLVDEGYPLPKYAPFGFKPGKLHLAFDNGDPTRFKPVSTLKVISSAALGLADDFMYPENVTSDPSATMDSPYSKSNEYLMETFLNKILTLHKPTLNVIWLRNPDTTEHNYGVGSPSYHTALQDQDRLLAKLLAKLDELGMTKSTNLIIASDHSHSNVSGPLKQFPLRLIHHGILSVPDEHGFSISGDFRPADLLARAGFKAYDGEGCQYDPALSGIKKTGELVYPIRVDKENKVCGQLVKIEDAYGDRHQAIGHLYTTPAYFIPKDLPADSIVVANNGGSTYFYVVNHDPLLTKKLVRFLQSRQEFGAIFVDDRYNNIDGVLPMTIIRLKNQQNRNPDVIASSSFDEKATILGIKGIEFSSCNGARGMHGSFSHTDIHNTLLAVGPDFKEQFVDPLPSANVDVPTTIAHLLNIPFSNTDGRVLYEALKNGLPVSKYSVVTTVTTPNKAADGLTYQLATDPSGKDVDKTKTHYTVSLESKILVINNKTYHYYDRATAKRY